MGSIVLSADETIDAAPETVFERFASSGDGGWLFGASCDRLAVGAVITLGLPLSGGHPVEITGRLSVVRRPRILTITHDQPWRGRITLRLGAVGGGTRVRLTAEVDEAGFEWLMRRQGFPVRSGPPVGHRIGLLTSKSGPGNLFAAATENLAHLAVDEINADGGLQHRPIELLVGDDGTDAVLGALEAQRLVRAGCTTIFVTTTSATWDSVSASLRDSGVLMIQPQMNEGGGESALRVRLGERPAGQLAAAATAAMRAAGGRRWFLAGNDYIWPRSLGAAARAVLPHFEGVVVGERYAPLGTVDHARLVEAAQASGAEIILNAFVGADSAAFERQCHAAGVRDSAVTLGPALDESTLSRIGEAAAAGILGVSGYFQELDNERNGSLVQRYRQVFGPWAAPLSTLSEAVFEAVHMWAAAARRAATTDPTRVGEQMRTGRFDFPRGPVTLDGSDRVQQRLYLAEARGATFTGVSPAESFR